MKSLRQESEQRMSSALREVYDDDRSFHVLNSPSYQSATRGKMHVERVIEQQYSTQECEG